MVLVTSLLFLLVLEVISAQEFKCPSGTGYYPDEFQCDRYYKCSQWKAEEKLCPDGLVFKDGDPNRERCDIPGYVDCGDRTELQETKSSPDCPHLNGYFRHPDPAICNKFFNCVNGKPHELSCPASLIFDDLGGDTCSWLSTSKRKDCGTSDKKGSLDDFTCPSEKVMSGNGRPVPHPTYPHPTDCSKFYICRDGADPSLGSCSGGSVYNDVTFQCDSPENVPGCEKP